MAKMPLAEHDNVVQTFPPDRTDRPFTISVLPRRSRRGWPIPNAHRPKAADEDVTVDGVAVTNDVLQRHFPTIGLGELVRNPFSRWVRRERRPAIRTLRGWAISVLQEAGAIRECEEHGWMRDRADPHARERALAIARRDPPSGVSVDEAVAEIRDVLDSIGDTCPECPPETD
jgi:hypothetical protein